MSPLETLGFGSFFADQRPPLDNFEALLPARVVVVYQDRLLLRAASGEVWGELSGNLRHRGRNRMARPAVGDWVLYEPNEGGGMSTVHHILERRTQLVRQASGRRPVPQVLAANIDRVAVVTTPENDFNLRRLERYLQAIHGGGAAAAIIINKIDRCDDIPALRTQLGELALAQVPVACVSATEKRGAEQLAELFAPTSTIALVGSSGVGKSTLINWWLGEDRQEVGEIREDDQKGRHTTTHRELFILPPRMLETAPGEPTTEVCGLLIDTPGIRELQPFSDKSVVDEVFPDIAKLARRCKFRDCSHRHEPRCAVLAAVAKGKLPKARLTSFHKLAHPESPPKKFG